MPYNPHLQAMLKDVQQGEAKEIYYGGADVLEIDQSDYKRA
jgi:hypothetical protein